MEQTITLSTLIYMGMIIMGVWGFIKVVKEIVSNITARHDREQKWDEMEDKLKRMEEKIDANHADTEEKIKEVKTELHILTNCMAAVLDGLKQQGCNGEVTKASSELDEYMRSRAHE